MGRRLDVLRAVAVVAIIFAATFVFSANAFAADNSTCLTCHATAMSMPVADVDRDTACAACHLDGFVGSHPYHQPGANCGAACHPGWGDSLLTAVPSYTDPVSGASFASATSKASSPAVLHVIHSASRWPASVSTSFSKCGSCHQPAACGACHTGAVSAQHADHSATGNATYPAYPSWTGTVGHGVSGGDQAQDTTAVETNQCASAGCHDLAKTASNRPQLTEDYNYAVGGNPEDPAGYNAAVVYTGTWRTKASNVYTGMRMSYNNVVGSALTVNFAGSRVELISDKDPYRGKADVYIDGAKVATIDCYSATTAYQAVVYTSPTLSNGAHTISVRPLNQKSASSRGTYVVVDAVNAYADLPASIAPECISCHDDKDTGHGGGFSHEATHTVGVESGFTCTSCHSLGLMTEHARTTSKSSATSPSCNACHTAYAPYSLISYDFTCGGTATTLDGAAQPCHNNAGQQKHDFVDGDHDATDNGPASADCRGCHGTDLSVIHTEGSGRAYNAQLSSNAWTVNCLSCHGPAKFPSTKDCTSSECHGATGGSGVVDMLTHPAPAHNATNNGQTDVARTGDNACSTCHSLEAVGEHGKATSAGATGSIGCLDCHGAAYFPTGWLATPGTSNTCTACHPTAGGEAGEPHELADYTSKHNYNDALNMTSCGSNTLACHSGSTALLGNLSNADQIHASTKPGTATCASCHTTNTAVPDKRQCLTSGCHAAGHNTMPAHNSSGALYAENAECIACHTSYTNVASAHPFNCVGCHDQATLTAGGTRYLNDTFTTRCVDCHSAGVLGTVYDPEDPNHYPLVNHTAAIAADTVSTGGAVIKSKSCTSCHSSTMKAEHALMLSAGAVDCIDCHTNTTLGSTTVIANNWPNDKCSDCHGTLHPGASTAHNLSDAACEGSGCHATTNLGLLHADAVKTGDPSVTSCNVCHTNADTSLSTVDACTDCHAGHDMSIHFAPNSQACVDCHESNDVRVVHQNSAKGACAVCHNNASWPGITTGLPDTDCVDCHNATKVGAKDYTGRTGSAPHYSTKLTQHTASETTPLSYPAYSANYPCGQCHSLSMWAEHVKTSAGFNLGSYADRCVYCHEVKADSLATKPWTDRCNACHAASHSEFSTKHDVSGIAANSTCSTGETCHNLYDVAEIHNNSRPLNDPTMGDDNCATAGCHTAGTAVSGVPTKKGCTDVGCHVPMDIAHNHPLDVAGSDYNNTTIAGCTNAGTGCHGNSTKTDYVINSYHPEAMQACNDGACHQSPSWTDPLFSADTPRTCGLCHGGRTASPYIYAGAPTVMSTQTVIPLEAHYNETTHTVPSLVGDTMKATADGSVVADCTDCHNENDVSGIGHLYAQHQGLTVARVTSATYQNVTCTECHNRNTQVEGVMKDTTRNDTCQACHSTGVMPGFEMHDLDVAPAVAGTPAAGCSALSCHGSTDIHELHKGGTKVDTCAEAGCHDYTKQGYFPTVKTCGEGGAGCHTTINNDNHGYNTTLHTATDANSVECLGCHQQTDLKTLHGNSCTICHANPAYASINGGDLGKSALYGRNFSTEGCVACHDVPPMAHTYTGHTSASGHYSSNATTHTASTTQMSTNLSGTVLSEKGSTWTQPTTGIAYSFACSSCHVNSLMDEHGMTGAAFSNVPTGTRITDKCTGCHNATNFATNRDLWTASKACDTCHKASGGSAPAAHSTMATKHNASAIAEAQRCGGGTYGADCHDISDVAKIHTLDATGSDGNAETQKCLLACHKGSTQGSRPVESTGLRCGNAGCHDGTGTTWWNDVNGASTTAALDEHALHHNTQSVNRRDGNAATGPAVQDGSTTVNTIAECVGCHEINRLDRDHFALTGAPYGTSPWSGQTSNYPSSYNGKACAPCHRKAANSTTPSTVNSASTKTAIATDDMRCTTCHTGTVWSNNTYWKMHQARGSSTVALGNTEFNNVYSGHKSFNFMQGAKTSFTTAADGVSANRTLTRPTLSSWMSNWSAATESTTMVVRCDDCHDYTGATGPHGAAMTIGVEAGYTNDYKSGGAYMNSTSPYIRSATGGTTNPPICAKCHQVTNIRAVNNAHSRSAHNGTTDGKCITCHSKVPHAWKRPYLIGYAIADPAAYKSLRVYAITERSVTSATGWAENNCGTVSTSGGTTIGSCAGGHGTLGTTPAWP